MNVNDVRVDVRVDVRALQNADKLMDLLYDEHGDEKITLPLDCFAQWIYGAIDALKEDEAGPANRRDFAVTNVFCCDDETAIRTKSKDMAGAFNADKDMYFRLLDLYDAIYRRGFADAMKHALLELSHSMNIQGVYSQLQEIADRVEGGENAADRTAVS